MWRGCKFTDCHIYTGLFFYESCSVDTDHGSTWVYYTLPLVYVALLDSTTLYHCSTWLYMTLLHPTMSLLGSTTFYCYSTLLYWTLLLSTMALLNPSWLYYTLPLL